MFASEKIRNVFHLLGYNERKTVFHIFPVVLHVIRVMLCVDVISYMYFNWVNNNSNTYNQRIQLVMAVKDINILITASLYSIEYMYANTDLNNLLMLIDKQFSKYGSDYQPAQRRLIEEKMAKQINSTNITTVSLYLIACSMVVLPALLAVYLILKNDVNSIEIEELLLPITVWYPKNYSNIKMYIFFYVCQTLFLLDGIGGAYCIFVSASCSLQTIIVDIDLLSLDLKDVDTLVTTKEEKKLRNYSRYLIHSHQQILRFAKLITRSVGKQLTYSNQSICFQLCVYLYSTAEVNNRLSKFGYGMLVISISALLMVYCKNGQNVIDATEELRASLYSSSWIDKPKWYKNHLHLMMTMTNGPLEIKPLGLYVLNLSTFTGIMNASYTYFNLLKTMKN